MLIVPVPAVPSPDTLIQAMFSDPTVSTSFSERAVPSVAVALSAVSTKPDPETVASTV
jgi:hypothetical protein